MATDIQQKVDQSWFANQAWPTRYQEAYVIQNSLIMGNPSHKIFARGLSLASGLDNFCEETEN